MHSNKQVQNPKKTSNVSPEQRSTHLHLLTRATHPASIIQQARASPDLLTSANVLQLQRTIGNQAVGQLMSEIGRVPTTNQQAPVQQQAAEEEELLQGKFTTECLQCQVPEEEEELMQGKFDPIQRHGDLEYKELLQGKFTSECLHCQAPEEEELMQGKAAPTNAGSKNTTKTLQNNTGMPDQLKAGLEQLSDINLSDVRVHYNSSKPAQINALAYTQGKNVHVASGQEKHLPHEGWHVVQQSQGRVRPTTRARGLAINDEYVLEREADVMGGRAAQLGVAHGAQMRAKMHLPVVGQAVQLSPSNEKRLVQAKEELKKVTTDVDDDNVSKKTADRFLRAMKKIRKIGGALDTSNVVIELNRIYDRSPLLQQHLKILGLTEDVVNDLRRKTKKTDRAIDISAPGTSLGANAAKIAGLNVEKPETAADLRYGEKINDRTGGTMTPIATGVNLLGNLVRLGRGFGKVGKYKGMTEEQRALNRQVAHGAFVDLSLGGMGTMKAGLSGASQITKALDATSSAAPVLSQVGGGFAVAGGVFVAAQQGRKAIKAIGRRRRLGKVDLQEDSNYRRDLEVAKSASTEKAITSSITSAGAAVAASGGIALLASNPVGWSIAIAGAAVGLAIGAYKGIKWLWKKIARSREAKRIVETLAQPKVNIAKENVLKAKQEWEIAQRQPDQIKLWNAAGKLEKARKDLRRINELGEVKLSEDQKNAIIRIQTLGLDHVLIRNLIAENKHSQAKGLIESALKHEKDIISRHLLKGIKDDNPDKLQDPEDDKEWNGWDGDAVKIVKAMGLTPRRVLVGGGAAHIKRKLK